MGSSVDRNKITISLFFFFFGLVASAKDKDVFTFYLKKEPVSIDPIVAVSGESNYLHATLFRGLTRYTDEGMLVFEDAERCRYVIDTDIRCKLRKNLKYSDGSPLIAQDYVRAFQRIKAPGSSSYISPLLGTLKEIKALSDNEIQFLLSEPDREFLEKLSNPLLVPFKNEKATNGPYFVAEVEKVKRWRLQPNPYFKRGNSNRPPIELLFVPADSTAFDLYEKGAIDFLWRLTSTEVNDQVKKRPDYKEIPLSRFDYIGFNMRPGKPLSDKMLREKLSQSLHFQDFQTMLFADGLGGCPSLGERFLQASPRRCLQEKKFDKITKWPHLQFKFSQLGGIDIEKQITWLREQWKTNLGVSVELKSMEQKAFINELKTNPPDIFRKGIGLNRPSCLAGLEFFKSDHPENFTGFRSKKFDEMIKPLQTRKLSRIEQDNLCAAATDYLFLEEHVGIPVGKMYFSMLMRTDFKGIKVNELNQLDLSELEYVGKK